jgi:uncharacterized peroxidase-related enzyme
VTPIAAADEPSATPKPVPATRPALKAALEALRQRQPRIPLPKVQSGDASHDAFLPETWGRGGGLSYLVQIMSRGARDLGAATRANSDALLTDLAFWVVSRGNNCQYCLGHQEIKLRLAGVNYDTVGALDSDWSRFPPREQAALTFARKLTLEPFAIAEGDIAALKKQFTDDKIVDLAFCVAVFNSVNRWTDGLGLPQEAAPRGDKRYELDTPTGEQFQITTSLATAATRRPRPSVATMEQVEQAIAAANKRDPQVQLQTSDDTRRELRDVIGAREPFAWETAMIQVHENGKTHIKAWNTILADDNLPPRLKSELSFITAVNNGAWYAAAHAAHRLRQMGMTTEDLGSLLESKGPAMSGAAAACQLAAKSTRDVLLVTDADIAEVRKRFGDRETVQILDVICLSNLFDRFTESLGLAVEDAVNLKTPPKR